MQLIGVHGKARSGKSTVAHWLHNNRNAFTASFADPIKESLIGMFKLTWEHFEIPTLKEQALPDIGRSPRYLAQTLGTEWGRNLVDPDLWVKLTQQRLALYHVWGKLGQVIVIPDVRFENEARWVREHGTLLHLVRDGANGEVGIRGHSSEAGIAPAAGDIKLENNGSFDELFAALNALFPVYGGGVDE